MAAGVNDGKKYGVSNVYAEAGGKIRIKLQLQTTIADSAGGVSRSKKSVYGKSMTGPFSNEDEAAAYAELGAEADLILSYLTAGLCQPSRLNDAALSKQAWQERGASFDGDTDFAKSQTVLNFKNGIDRYDSVEHVFYMKQDYANSRRKGELFCFLNSPTHLIICLCLQHWWPPAVPPHLRLRFLNVKRRRVHRHQNVSEVG